MPWPSQVLRQRGGGAAVATTAAATTTTTRALPLRQLGERLMQHASQKQHRKQQQQQQQRPLVVYLKDFFDRATFDAIRQEAAALAPQLSPELNCIAVGRLGCYLGERSASTRAFARPEVARRLTAALVGGPDAAAAAAAAADDDQPPPTPTPPLQLADFPLELRRYPVGAHMGWHLDEQMYAEPQWELIYTVSSSSDADTRWIDAQGAVRGVRTAPNSLLCVRAEGWQHMVTPGSRGQRDILKLAFASTLEKLDAFSVNLEREAYAGSPSPSPSPPSSSSSSASVGGGGDSSSSNDSGSGSTWR